MIRPRRRQTRASPRATKVNLPLWKSSATQDLVTQRNDARLIEPPELSQRDKHGQDQSVEDPTASETRQDFGTIDGVEHLMDPERYLGRLEAL